MSEAGSIPIQGQLKQFDVSHNVMVLLSHM